MARDPFQISSTKGQEEQTETDDRRITPDHTRQISSASQDIAEDRILRERKRDGPVTRGREGLFKHL